MKITKFTGQHRFLSNFYPCKVAYDGRIWPSTEHAYQAAKTTDKTWKDRIFNASTGDAKRLGFKAPKTEDWEQRKLKVMWDLLVVKFSQPKLKQLLLQTGNEELIEGNWWGDRFWGVCGGIGENHLGNMLMKLREQSRNDAKKESPESSS